MRKWIYLALAVVCVLYGVSIFVLRSGSRFFLVWFAAGAVFLGLFQAVQADLWHRLPGLCRGLFLAALLLGLAGIGAENVLILRHFRDRGTSGLPYIVVLGAQVWSTGPSASLASRLDTAREYLEENPETLCIVSGGQGSNEPWSEAKGMRDYLVERGVDETRILLEEQSTNTLENIRFSMRLADLADAPVGIVTNNFHVYRGVSIARAQGMRQAVGIAAPSHLFYLPNNLFRECFGIAKDLLGHNMHLS